jgi:hypothetical protein
MHADTLPLPECDRRDDNDEQQQGEGEDYSQHLAQTAASRPAPGVGCGERPREPVSACVRRGVGVVLRCPRPMSRVRIVRNSEEASDIAQSCDTQAGQGLAGTEHLLSPTLHGICLCSRASRHRSQLSWAMLK